MDVVGSSNGGYPRGRTSCLQCQRLKKRCDRNMPRCSLCARHHRSCSYSGTNHSVTSTESATSQIASSLSPLPTSDGSSAFPAVYFLDSALFHRSLRRLPTPNLVLTDDLQSSGHNIHTEREFIGIYFNSIHPWIPFLSKKHFVERILSPLGPARPENTLLVAAVKLVALTPPNLVARSAVYRSIKANLFGAEASGLLELKIFQGLILIALYELGHAIYPEAYMTIGYCLRYGQSLGLEKTVEQASPEGFDNLEAEERRRGWWAAVLLDHLMNLGCPPRASSIGQPNSTSLLPADDLAWDNDGQPGIIQHRLCDPPKATMGRFCLTAQAAILLGKVFTNLHDPADDRNMRDLETKVLDHTIAALTDVSLQEGRLRGVGVCSPTTICYRSGLFFAREYSISGKQTDLEALEDIKTGLRVSSNRWRAADSYLEMLDARILTGIL